MLIWVTYPNSLKHQLIDDTDIAWFEKYRAVSQTYRSYKTAQSVALPVWAVYLSAGTLSPTGDIAHDRYYLRIDQPARIFWVLTSCETEWRGTGAA